MIQVTWRKLAYGQEPGSSETLPPLPSRLVTEDDLKEFYEAMKIYDVPKTNEVPNVSGVKRKGANLGGLDTQHYGRGKRTREVCHLFVCFFVLICLFVLFCLVCFFFFRIA